MIQSIHGQPSSHPDGDASVPYDELTTGELFRRAQQITDRGRVGEAISLYQHCLHREPRNGVIRNNLGCLLMGAGRLDDALHHLGEM